MTPPCDEGTPRVSAFKEWFDRLLAGPRPGETGRQSAEAILTKHAGRLMRIRGVMSIGIGRDDDGRTAILVGVTSDAPDAVGELPEALEGVKVIKRTY